jgi:hypothetical protein
MAPPAQAPDTRPCPPHDPATENLLLPLTQIEVEHLILGIVNLEEAENTECRHLLDKLRYLDSLSYLNTTMDTVARARLAELHETLKRRT